MNVYVYSDESGVFDKEHNDYFVFGGLILLGTESKENWSRKYSSVEKILRVNKGVTADYELKATQVSNKEKGKLFRALNGCYKFGAVINESRVLDRIYLSKKDKQRYLDYAYKIAVKRAFENLIQNKVINSDEVERLFFYVDEHTTATNGQYELQEALEQEFKLGTYNSKYDTYYPPIFRKMKDVKLEYCNSASKLLVRAADIVANKIFYLARNEKEQELKGIQNLTVTYLP
ncbi:MAG: DUF3800 domain-containing protein [Lachnospiraceae bacterium]|nr:DUF3800 domain-containing protein [Lachnospiraceae bacterium]